MAESVPGWVTKSHPKAPSGLNGAKQLTGEEETELARFLLRERRTSQWLRAQVIDCLHREGREQEV